MNRNFKVLHIEHIAIAVENSKSAKVFFGDLLGMDISKTELVESENVLVSKKKYRKMIQSKILLKNVTFWI